MNKILLFACVLLFACKQPPKAEQQTDIHTIQTSKHVRIPGTRVFIVPPADFHLANGFPGLQKNETSMLQVLDLEGGNFYTNATDLSKAAFEKRGIRVLEYQEMTLNNYPCKLLVAQANAQMKSINMVFGDSTFSTMIMGVCTPGDEKTETAIRAALKTVYYDKNIKTDPLANAAFTLDVSQSSFKLSKATAGMFIYTVGGKEDGQSTVLMVNTLPNDATMTAEDIAKQFLAKSEQYGFQHNAPERAAALEVNGHPGYEMNVKGAIKGQESSIYLLVVAGRDKALVVQGVIRSDIEKNLAAVQKLARTIQLK